MMITIIVTEVGVEAAKKLDEDEVEIPRILFSDEKTHWELVDINCNIVGIGPNNVAVKNISFLCILVVLLNNQVAQHFP
ncbi:MAG: hypothetical protein H0V82_04405 [Candidatus Protochlamydia sp.]|nr:hypothetical protein [Candidatus Protochlamydia sp.]